MNADGRAKDDKSTSEMPWWATTGWLLAVMAGVYIALTAMGAAQVNGGGDTAPPLAWIVGGIGLGLGVAGLLRRR